MNAQSIKFSLGFAFAVLIAILAAVGLLALDRMERVKADMNYLVQHCWNKVELSRQALGYSTANNRITLQVFLLTNQTDIDLLLAQRKQNTEKISELFTNLQQVLDSAPERQLLADVNTARTPYVASYQRALKLQFQEHQPEAARAMMVQVTLPLLINYHAAWNAFVGFQGRQMEASARLAASNYQKTRTEMVGLMLLALVGALAITVLTTRKVLSESARRQRAEQELRLAHDELEARIRQRTTELNLANTGLTFEIAERKRTEEAMRLARDQAEAAHHRLQLEMKNLEAAQRRTDIQHAVSHVLAQADTIGAAAPKIIQAICETLGWDFGAFWQPERADQQLHCVEMWHRPELVAGEFTAATRQKGFASGEGLPGRVWDTAQPAWIQDVVGDQNFPRAPFAAKAGLHAAFGFPVLLDHEFLGVFEFFSHDIFEPDSQLLGLVAALGSQIAQFIEWEQAERELKHEQFLFRTLLDNLPDRIYFKDAQNRYIRNNRAHLKRLGVKSFSEARGKTDFDFFAEDTARRTSRDEQEIMRTGAPINKEEKTISAEGIMAWSLITKMPLRDETGTLMGTFGISRDITNLKRAEEAMRQARDAAEEANRTKSQFLANMSHELRTPLNSVIGFASILLKNKAANLSQNDLNFLERIQANGKHLLALINEILDLSKIEAGKIELQLEPVALDVLVRETVAQQEGLVRDRPVQLLADLPASVAPIQADGEKLRQVIINLIGNALKFTERGSVTVRVVTHPVDHRPLRIEVSDTGIGIPQEKLGLIFQAFQQADASTARKYGGTGLGLTISQALCHLMNCRITVASEPGRGSTFSVNFGGQSAVAEPELSHELPAAIAPGTPSVPATSELHGKLVLVIDDESDSRFLLTHLLEEFGCQVIVANSGEQGLRMAHEFRPHLITVDLLMPQMDGATVIRAIKADPTLRSIPVVVVSIVAEERRGSILGAVDVLEKPIVRDDLLLALKRSLLPDQARILIVDDEADARQILLSYLAEEPVEVRTATNGREALAELETFPPDLILCDLVMPVMDGVAFLNALRSDARYQQLPVIIITSKELSPPEKDQLRLKTLAVVRKTDLSEENFKQLLHRILNQAGAHSRPAEIPG